MRRFVGSHQRENDRERTFVFHQPVKDSSRRRWLDVFFVQPRTLMKPSVVGDEAGHGGLGPRFGSNQALALVAGFPKAIACQEASSV